MLAQKKVIKQECYQLSFEHSQWMCWSNTSRKSVHAVLFNSIICYYTGLRGLFHACAAVVRNERSPIVWSRVRGMTSCWRHREPERRRCSASVSSVQRKSRRDTEAPCCDDIAEIKISLHAWVLRNIGCKSAF